MNSARDAESPSLAQEFALLGRLWLHEPSAGDTGRAAAELGFPETSHGDLAAEYANLFLVSVPPYGSVFTDERGELNGEEAQFAAAVFGAADFHPDELNEVAGADHLGLGLLFFARSPADESHEAGFLIRLVQWAPVCCAAVGREPGVHPFYRMLAARTCEALLERLDNNGYVGDDVSATQVAGQVAAQDVQDDASLGEDETSLSDILAFILAPARCGLFLSRARLGRIAFQFDLRLPFGSRYDVARSLFAAAGESENVSELLDALLSEIAWAEREYRAWTARHPAWSGAARAWLARTSEAQRQIARLRAGIR